MQKERDEADAAAQAVGKAAAAAEAALKKLERDQATVGEREKHLQVRVPHHTALALACSLETLTCRHIN